MNVIYGLALTSASVLLFAYMLKIKNRPIPAKWTQSKILLQIAMFTLFIGVIFGVAVVVKFLVNITTVEFGAFEAGLVFGIVVATGLIWRIVRPSPQPPD